MNVSHVHPERRAYALHPIAEGQPSRIEAYMLEALKVLLQKNNTPAAFTAQLAWDIAVELVNNAPGS